MASNLDISNAFLLYLHEIKNNGWGSVTSRGRYDTFRFCVQYPNGITIIIIRENLRLSRDREIEGSFHAIQIYLVLSRDK